MTATGLFVDVETPVRDWLRTVNLSGIGERVYVGLPAGATLLALEVSLLDGGITAGEAPVADTQFSFSVWGEKSQRAAAASAAWSLVSVLHSVRSTPLSTLTLLGARVVLGPVPRFDPDGTPRYLLDAALTVRVSA